MKTAHWQDRLDKNWQAQIDRDTWQELTRLFERVVDTLGVIAPVLELAKNRTTAEKKRHLRAVTDLAFRGQQALKAFGQRWALVQEENLRRPAIVELEDFADIYQAAQQIQILDAPPNLDSIMAEEPHDLQAAQQIPSLDAPPHLDSVGAKAAPDLG